MGAGIRADRSVATDYCGGRDRCHITKQTVDGEVMLTITGAVGVCLSACILPGNTDTTGLYGYQLKAGWTDAGGAVQVFDTRDGSPATDGPFPVE